MRKENAGRLANMQGERSGAGAGGARRGVGTNGCGWREYVQDVKRPEGKA